MTEQEYAENVGKVIEDEPMDRIEEIKERCEAATPGPWENDTCFCVSTYLDAIWKNDICECDNTMTENGEANTEFIANAREDIPFLLDEIDHLKMMLGKMVERNENLRLDYLDAVAERDAAVEDLRLHGDCDTCKNNNTLDCNIDGETGGCNFEWRGVQK